MLQQEIRCSFAKNYMAGYQEIEFPTTFDTLIPRSTMPLEADPSVRPPEAYQIVNLDPIFSPNATISTPSIPHSQHGQRIVTGSMDAKIQKPKSQTVRFRIARAILHEGAETNYSVAG